ncbi:uncharacterized protein [Amphiura filiformis]|uniref:uncharacterized protein n=1 Tax=Amphiura filiformis TaxID=82378 RepID=UPI003B213A68
MEKFLAENGDASIRDILKENDVDDLEVLASMTESDFEKLGIISFGKRRKLVLAIQKLKSIGQNHEPSEQQQGPCDVPEHFYSEHNGTGFIQSRLKNVRTASGERLKKKKKETTNHHIRVPAEDMATDAEEAEIDIQDMQEKIDWMKFSPPNPTTMKKHITYFKETFHYRRAFIANLDHSVTDVLDVFPRVQDVDALIAIDFSMMHGDLTADTFISKWSSFREKVMQVGRKEENVTQLVERFEDADRDLCALTIIIYLLHRPLAKKGQSCSRVDAVRYLFYNVPEGTHVFFFFQL